MNFLSELLTRFFQSYEFNIAGDATREEDDDFADSLITTIPSEHDEVDVIVQTNNYEKGAETTAAPVTPPPTAAAIPITTERSEGEEYARDDEYLPAAAGAGSLRGRISREVFTELLRTRVEDILITNGLPGEVLGSVKIGEGSADIVFKSDLKRHVDFSPLYISEFGLRHADRLEEPAILVPQGCVSLAGPSSAHKILAASMVTSSILVARNHVTNEALLFHINVFSELKKIPSIISKFLGNTKEAIDLKIFEIKGLSLSIIEDITISLIFGFYSNIKLYDLDIDSFPESRGDISRDTISIVAGREKTPIIRDVIIAINSENGEIFTVCSRAGFANAETSFDINTTYLAKIRDSSTYGEEARVSIRLENGFAERDLEAFSGDVETLGVSFYTDT